MAWDGNERRQSSRGYCDSHIKLVEDTAIIKNTLLNLDRRINGSIDDIHHHIEESNKFREMILAHDIDIKNFKGTKTASIATFAGVVGLIITAIWWGGTTNRQIDVNTKRLDRLEVFEKKGVSHDTTYRINS